jgi:hypothetical protein
MLSGVLRNVIAETGVDEVVGRLGSSANTGPSVTRQIAVRSSILKFACRAVVDAVYPASRKLGDISGRSETGTGPWSITVPAVGKASILQPVLLALGGA